MIRWKGWRERRGVDKELGWEDEVEEWRSGGVEEWRGGKGDITLSRGEEWRNKSFPLKPPVTPISVPAESRLSEHWHHGPIHYLPINDVLIHPVPHPLSPVPPCTPSTKSPSTCPLPPCLLPPCALPLCSLTLYSYPSLIPSSLHLFIWKGKK